MSHYDYLNKYLEQFWLAIFGKSLEEMGCAGIISAAGDKGYSYKKLWEDEGIHFYHGMAVYLLTYTTELGDTPKHQSGVWVVENYHKYKVHLPDVD